MPRLSPAHLFAALLLSSLAACTCGTGPVAKSSGALTLPMKDLDFHQVCINDTVPLQFELRNDSRARLTIEKLSISATQFQIMPAVQLPAVIGPEGTLELTIAFTPPHPGDFVATLTVTSDAATNGTQTATLIGTGFNGEPKNLDVTCQCDRNTSDNECGLSNGTSTDDPCSFLTFIAVPNGASVTRTLTLENKGCEPLTINTSLYDGDNMSQSDASTMLFSVAGMPSVHLLGGQKQDVTVTFNPTGNMELNPNVRMKIQSDATNTLGANTSPGLADIGLIASSVVPQLSVTPTKLAFFSTPMGQTGTQTFTVSNAGNTALMGVSIMLQPDAGTSDFALQLVNNESTFTLAATGNPQGMDTRVETIAWTPTKMQTQHARVYVQAPGYTISPNTPCDQVTGTMAPCIDVYGGVNAELSVQWSNDNGATFKDPPIDFGMTATGATNEQLLVRLMNIGLANLDVTSVQTRDITNMTNSTSFSVTGFAPGTIRPQDHQDLTLVFNDDIRLQDDAGKLAIASNDPVDATNGTGQRLVDIHSTNAPDFPPVANISVSPSSTVMPCGMLRLDGSGTMPSQPTDTVTYQWKITSAPPGSTAFLATPTQATTVVQSMNCTGPDLVGTYTFTLTASDQYPGNTGAPATTTVKVQ